MWHKTVRIKTRIDYDNPQADVTRTYDTQKYQYQSITVLTNGLSSQSCPQFEKKSTAEPTSRTATPCPPPQKGCMLSLGKVLCHLP